MLLQIFSLPQESATSGGVVSKHSEHQSGHRGHWGRGECSRRVKPKNGGCVVLEAVEAMLCA